MARAIVVPPQVEPLLDRLIARFAARNGVSGGKADARSVEVTVLQRGIAELEKDLREFEAAGDELTKAAADG